MSQTCIHGLELTQCSECRKHLGISVEDYEEKSQIQHIYEIPDTYIGSDSKLPREEWYLTFPGGKPQAVFGEVTWPVGAERLFIEILSNAGDNVPRSRRADIDPGTIKVTMNATTVKVQNEGLVIPIQIHPKTGKLLPDMIFGSLLTGSNFNDHRQGSGRNGYGAKLTNIFSKAFMVEIGNNIDKRYYRRIWKNRMTPDPVELKEGYTGKNYISITYVMDFERFKYKLQEGYPPEAFGIYARLCADLANSWKIPVSFNDYTFNFKKAREYEVIYFPETGDGLKKERSDLQILLYPQGTEMIKKGRKYVPKDGNVPLVGEVILIDTQEYNSQVISFVNGMMTRDGGVHVDAFMKHFSTSILGTLKEEFSKASGKGKGKSEGPKDRFPLTIADVRNNLSMIVNFYVTAPKFSSQSKTKFTEPAPHVDFPADILAPVYKWEFMHKLYLLMNQRQEMKMSKTDGKKVRYLNMRNLSDCNDAGKPYPKSHECACSIVEGVSAAEYMQKARDFIPQGKDRIAVFPIRGKLLNVMNAPPGQIVKNKEISELKKVIGLHEFADYTKDEEFRKLRYGRIIIVTDADVDGEHIRGLIYTFFWTRFPTLFSRPGFFLDLQSPIIKINYKSQRLSFYSSQDYRKFSEENTLGNIKPDYFKGLGSSGDDDIKDDFKDPRYLPMVMDNQGPTYIHLAFDKRYPDKRKEWINNHVEPESMVTRGFRNMTNFINTRLIDFSIHDIIRSIPRFQDGLKDSQRKALWGAYLRWKGFDHETFEKSKVNAFANSTVEPTCYHHGEKSLIDTIICMVHDFVGSNNMPYFVPDGQFGSRLTGGKIAANSRYTYTRPEWWLKYVYPKADMPLLNQVWEENQKIGPEVFYPIIPMVLVNGCNGIGTGWSTFIPNHDPLVIIEWYRCRILDKDELPCVYPWYRGFRGKLTLYNRDTKKRIDITPDDPIPTPKNSNAGGKIKIKINGVSRMIEADVPLDELAAIPTIDPYDRVFEERSEPEPEGSGSGSGEEGDKKDPTLEEEHDEGEIPAYSLITQGVFHVNQDEDVIIEELPVGRWTNPYIDWLKSLIEDKQIKGFSDDGTVKKPSIKIVGFENPSVKSLRLVKKFSMTNMYLLNLKNKLVKYNSVEEILEDYYHERLEVYQKRKDYQLAELQKQIDLLLEKKKFVMAVISEPPQLIIAKRKKSDILLDMDRLGIRRDILDKTRITSITEDSVKKLLDKIAENQEKYRILSETSPGIIWLGELEEFEKEYKRRYKKEKKEK